MDKPQLQLARDDVVELELNVRIDGQIAVITVGGDIDAAMAPVLCQTVESVAGEKLSVVVDLSGVTYAGASAVSALLAAHKHFAATDRTLTIRNVTPAVARVLSIADVGAVLTDHESQVAAGGTGHPDESLMRSVTEELEGLRRAMETRAVIEQAKGVIMGATNCDADHAFDLLRQQSQHQNRKLRDVAADIVADVGLPHAN